MPPIGQCIEPSAAMLPALTSPGTLECRGGSASVPGPSGQCTIALGTCSPSHWQLSALPTCTGTEDTRYIEVANYKGKQMLVTNLIFAHDRLLALHNYKEFVG